MMAAAQVLVSLVALVLYVDSGGAAAATEGSGSTRHWMSGREVNVASAPPPWDSKGYVLAFACQGRFGNQFDYLLGTLDYAKKIDRTLVLVRTSSV